MRQVLIWLHRYQRLQLSFTVEEVAEASGLRISDLEILLDVVRAMVVISPADRYPQPVTQDNISPSASSTTKAATAGVLDISNLHTLLRNNTWKPCGQNAKRWI